MCALFVCSAWEHYKSRKTYMIGSLYDIYTIYQSVCATQGNTICANLQTGFGGNAGKDPPLSPSHFSSSFLFPLPPLYLSLVVKRTVLLPQEPQLIGNDSGSNQVVLPWCHKNLVEKKQNPSN